MAPRVTIDKIFAFGPLPEEVVVGLKEAGLSLQLAEPWPGTLRLNEAGPGEPEVQSHVEMELTDVEAYRQASARIEAAAAVDLSPLIADITVEVLGELRGEAKELLPPGRAHLSGSLPQPVTNGLARRSGTAHYWL